MTVSDNVIIGESISHKAGRILKAIRKGKKSGRIFWYGITSAPEEENLMYIVSSVEMGRRFYHESGLTLIGLAGSRKEALEIVEKLVTGGLCSGNIHSMKKYLESIYRQGD